MDAAYQEVGAWRMVYKKFLFSWKFFTSTQPISVEGRK